MVFETCAIIAVFIFAILAYYVITTLRAVKRSLQNVNQITCELDEKMKQLESTFNTISHVGDFYEERTRHLCAREFQHVEPEFKKNDCSEDIIDLVVAGLKLGVKFLRR